MQNRLRFSIYSEMFVVDLKGGYNYDKKGIFNQNLRIRNKMGEYIKNTTPNFSAKEQIIMKQAFYLQFFN